MKVLAHPRLLRPAGHAHRRLGIAVPALVSQEGKRLRIDEMEVTAMIRGPWFTCPRARAWPAARLARNARRRRRDHLHRQVPNPITDICWSASCRSASAAPASATSVARKTSKPGSPVCTCGVNPTIGPVGRLLGAGAARRGRAQALLPDHRSAASTSTPGIPAHRAARFTRPKAMATAAASTRPTST